MRFDMIKAVDHKTGDVGIKMVSVEENLPDPLMDRVTVISQWSVRTRDKLIHDALIELGWTPPTEKPHG